MAGLIPLLARYSLEILAIVVAATAATSLVRLPPRARLIVWQSVVIACLLLPLAPPQIIEVAVAATASASTASIGRTTPSGAAAFRSPSGLSLDRLLPWLLLAGSALRGLWLAIGLLRLKSLAQRSEPALLDDDVRVLKQTLAPGAEILWHQDLRQAVTFGLRRPLVLLPIRLRAAAPEIRRAVVCHELVHIERRDWPSTLIEEAILTAFWYHPAMWWAISQIQLHRETTVDARVVQLTGSRRVYMEALLDFADDGAPALAPVFARRRQIVLRIRELSQEVVMSPMRIAIAAVALALVAATGWSVIAAVPIRTEARYQTAAPASPPQLRVLSKMNPDYPAEASGRGVEAAITVRLTIAPTGDVVEAKTVKWRLTFDSDIDDPNYFASRPQDAFIAAAEAAARRVKFAPIDARAEVNLLYGFRERRDGEPLPTSPAATGGVRVLDSSATPGVRIVRLGAGIPPPRKIADTRPAYPDAAKAAGIQGPVVMEVRVATDGSVADATVMQSIPQLDAAALDAVRHWRYQPTLLNGEAVEVMMTVTINFIAQ